MQMILPDWLKPGDVIGVVAPSSGVVDSTDVTRFHNAVSTLSKRGYRTIFTDNVFTDDGERSAPPKERAKQLEQLFESPEIKCIISAKGGFTLNEMLPFINIKTLKNNPKWFQGYSDNTDLCILLTCGCEIMSSYAGNYGDYGMNPWHDSIEYNLKILEGKEQTIHSFDKYESSYHDRIIGTEPYVLDTPVYWKSYGKEEFDGTLIGGCSDKISLMIDTKKEYITDFVKKREKIVWFLETYDDNTDNFKKLLQKMEKKGWFSNTSGIIFGRPLFYNGNYIQDVKNVLEHLEIPMIFDADVGHKAPRMTMICGANASIHCDNGKGVVKYKFHKH